MDRLIRARALDEDGVVILGATFRILVDQMVVGTIDNPDQGKATFQLPTTKRALSVEVEFKGVSDRVALAADCDEWTFQLPVFQGDHLVLLVHGINTRAHWVTTVQRELESAGMKVAPAGYGFYGLVRFLTPSDRLRRQAIERVRIRYNAAMVVHKPARVSVIAHSFGTYVVARLMAQEFNIKWHRIIFCGSVVPNTFPFEQYLNRFTPPIINEVGTKDIWPALAEVVTWGYGSIGSHGFQGAPLRERWHRGFSHSVFLEPSFAAKYWTPFLTRGEIVDGDDPEPLPLGIRLLTAVPGLRWLLWSLLGAIAFLLGRWFILLGMKLIG